MPGRCRRGATESARCHRSCEVVRHTNVADLVDAHWVVDPAEIGLLPRHAARPARRAILAVGLAARTRSEPVAVRFGPPTIGVIAVVVPAWAGLIYPRRDRWRTREGGISR